jgi:hypothetical protein
VRTPSAIRRPCRALRYRGAVVALLAAVGLLLPPGAPAHVFRPPPHRLFHGVSDTGHVRDYRTFRHRVRAHSALMEDFYHWDTPLTTGALDRWRQTKTRGVLSLSTAPGGGAEMITPRQIAHGHGDHYLLSLNESIAKSKQVVYIRLFPEMNGYWNPYCAYNLYGSYRGQSHSTRNFRRAWRRIVLIVRGGSRRKVNRALRHHGMKRIYRASSNHAPVYRHRNVPRRLPHPRVAFMWSPQTIASPNVPGNAPSAYWPGRRFVDWVGADIYSAFASPGVWSALKHFYRRWHHWPFVVGEYSPWNNDYSGHFTRQLFNWAEDHGRVRALIYYRSVSPDNEFDINHWPRARVAIRHHLNKHRWDAYAPRTRRR